MRVAAIYDIHGNLPALEAVLEDIRKERVDQIVVGGGVVPGPMPCETLTRLGLEGAIHFVQGNGEVAVLEAIAGMPPVGVPESYQPAMRWVAEQLSAEHKRLLSSWPKTLRLSVEEIGVVLFCHATPRNENELFTHLTQEKLLLPIFSGLDADLVVCGHTHMQFDRMIGAVRVVNAGSVGMPFGDPGADWLLLGPGVDLRHTSYDLTQAAQQICATKYPRAAEFAARNVLQPPSADKMLEIFSRAEMRQ